MAPLENVFRDDLPFWNMATFRFTNRSVMTGKRHGLDADGPKEVTELRDVHPWHFHGTVVSLVAFFYRTLWVQTLSEKVLNPLNGVRKTISICSSLFGLQKTYLSSPPSPIDKIFSFITMNFVCINLITSNCNGKRPTKHLLLCKEVTELSTFNNHQPSRHAIWPTKEMLQKFQPRTLGNIYHIGALSIPLRWFQYIPIIRHKETAHPPSHQAEKNNTFCSFTSRVAGKKHGWHLGAQGGCDANVSLPAVGNIEVLIFFITRG